METLCGTLNSLRPVAIISGPHVVSQTCQFTLSARQSRDVPRQRRSVATVFVSMKSHNFTPKKRGHGSPNSNMSMPAFQKNSCTHRGLAKNKARFCIAPCPPKVSIAASSMEDFHLNWSVSGDAEVSHLLTEQQKRSLATKENRQSCLKSPRWSAFMLQSQ